MKEAERIVEECAARGIVLLVGEAGALDYDAPAGVLTPDLRARLVAHKSDLVQLVFEREERAALSGCPSNVSAEQWARVLEHPAIIKLQSLGLCHLIIGVRSRRRREEAA